MSHVLAMVLISLALPAVALAVILLMERTRTEPEEVVDLDSPPEFEVSAQAKTAVDTAAEQPRYRKRAG